MLPYTAGCCASMSVEQTADRTAPGRKRVLDRDACQIIPEWVSGCPQDYKFESGTWHMSMIKMIRDTMCIVTNPRTIRRALNGDLVQKAQHTTLYQSRSRPSSRGRLRK